MARAAIKMKVEEEDLTLATVHVNVC